MTLKVIIEPGEDRGFIAHVPALKGCWSQGATREEALANIREAIEGWLETEQDKSEGSSQSLDVELVTVQCRGRWRGLPFPLVERGCCGLHS
jgi:predicted RNase H-like HicB family nuclease